MNEYGCYMNEYGDYLWTNNPKPNWIYIPEIKNPSEMLSRKTSLKPTLTPAPTPAPTPTITPSPIPTPTPSPVPSPSPTPTQKRFYSINITDESETIIDREYNYEIMHDKANGEYIAYNEEGEKVYHIYNDGSTSFAFNYGNKRLIIHTNDKMTIDTIPANNFTINADNGRTYFIENGKIFKSYAYKDGEVLNHYYYDENGMKYKAVHPDGNIYFYDENGETKHIYPDGLVSFKTEANGDFCISKNNTYVLYRNDGSTAESGTYQINENGDYICKSDNGATLQRDKDGHLITSIDVNGNVKHNDYQDGRQISNINGRITYSKIGHIEYDEESYNKILSTLNGIEENMLDKGCLNIESAINSFPDSYSGSNIGSVRNNMKCHISLIKSLSEMTNYSLLAYQICDVELKNGLFLLVNSIFGEENTQLADNFKNIIKNSIEDRDNDKIMEYKKETDFDVISKNALAVKQKEDDDGNIWYMNQNQIVVGVKGDNFKLKYSGEDFTVKFENGMAIVKDSKGNALSIFGDYNIDSEQFGGNQMQLQDSYNNSYVNDVISKYFPTATMEEKMALLNKATDKGCGYTAITDFVFEHFKGNEKEFYETFGYPMYEIRRGSSTNNESFSIDYNYEPVILDLFCKVNGKQIEGAYNIEETIKCAMGTSEDDIEKLINSLSSERNVTFDNVSNEIKFYADCHYNLYNLNGVLYLHDGGAHGMVGVGYTENGKPLVSSWGKKFIYEPSNPMYNRYYGTTLSSSN